jgi:hypothetical protein
MEKHLTCNETSLGSNPSPGCRFCGLFVNKEKQYCDVFCQQAHRREKRIAEWLRTGIALKLGSSRTHYVRHFLYEQQKNRCAVCGLEARWNNQLLALVLDHVDGNAENNNRKNLRLICPNCDSQLPTFKSRNRGKGRHARKLRYRAGLSF